MQASPISAVAGGVPVVIGSGKMGYVYEMNATTGKLIWWTCRSASRTGPRATRSSSGSSTSITLKVPYTIWPRDRSAAC